MAVENNLIDVEMNFKESQCLVTHYQRAGKQCISLELSADQTWAIPLSKVQTYDSLISVIATLPGVRKYTGKDGPVKWVHGHWARPARIQWLLETAHWSLVDSTGLAIRTEDWEDLIYAGAHIIIETNGAGEEQLLADEADINIAAVKANGITQDEKIEWETGPGEAIADDAGPEESRKLRDRKNLQNNIPPLEPSRKKSQAQANISQIEPPEEDDGSQADGSETQGPEDEIPEAEPAIDELPQELIVFDEDENQRLLQAGAMKPKMPVTANKPVSPPLSPPQRDGEWASWDTSGPADPTLGWAWEASGSVPPEDDAWGNDTQQPPMATEAYNPGIAGMAGGLNHSFPSMAAWMVQHQLAPGQISNVRPPSPLHAHRITVSPSLSIKPSLAGTIAGTIAPPKISKTDREVHLTFYTPFSLPRNTPPSPEPAFHRLSMPPEAKMQRLAERILKKPPFKDTMNKPDRDIAMRTLYVFLEFKQEISAQGKYSARLVDFKKIRGASTLQAAGFVPGQHYEFMVKNFFHPEGDFRGMQLR